MAVVVLRSLDQLPRAKAHHTAQTVVQAMRHLGSEARDKHNKHMLSTPSKPIKHI
jgi:hypothetical protein